MGGEAAAPIEQVEVLALLDGALSAVFDYLLRRVRDRPVAEDLTSETMLAAFGMARRGAVETVSTAWLIGIARHKLVDHWRRQSTEQRRLTVVAHERRGADDRPFEQTRAAEVLLLLNPSHRAALTLRYVDGLSVPEVAGLLGRSVTATENLLMRAKSAFRHRYATVGGAQDD
jgi:RNA polymerase sigma-70 factor (ECF subfamily)